MLKTIVDLDEYTDWTDLGIKNSCTPNDLLQKVVYQHVEMKRAIDGRVKELGFNSNDG